MIFTNLNKLVFVCCVAVVWPCTASGMIFYEETWAIPNATIVGAGTFSGIAGTYTITDTGQTAPPVLARDHALLCSSGDDDTGFTALILDTGNSVDIMADTVTIEFDHAPGDTRSDIRAILVDGTDPSTMSGLQVEHSREAGTLRVLADGVESFSAVLSPKMPPVDNFFRISFTLTPDGVGGIGVVWSVTGDFGGGISVQSGSGNLSVLPSTTVLTHAGEYFTRWAGGSSDNFRITVADASGEGEGEGEGESEGEGEGEGEGESEGEGEGEGESIDVESTPSVGTAGLLLLSIGCAMFGTFAFRVGNR